MRISHAGLSLLLIALGAGTAGCLHASAKAVTESPPLDMPSPPPRVVETVVVNPPPPLLLVEEPARQPIPPPAQPPPRAGSPTRSEPPRAEPPVEPPVEPAKVAEEPPKPPPTLQTTPAEVEGDMERAITVVINRAATALSRVNYRALNTNARTQYDTAKRFIQQAEDALKKRNLVFARDLADKAMGLAAQLAGR